MSYVNTLDNNQKNYVREEIIKNNGKMGLAVSSMILITGLFVSIICSLGMVIYAHYSITTALSIVSVKVLSSFAVISIIFGATGLIMICKGKYKQSQLSKVMGERQLNQVKNVIEECCDRPRNGRNFGSRTRTMNYF